MLSWQSLSFFLLLGSSNGLKHNFYLSGDDRTLIGPVGAPFGFLPGGVFELQVDDFQLTSTKSQKGRKKGWWDPRKPDPPTPTEEEEDENIKGFQAGFFLARFENEASFNQYMEYLTTNTSRCAFDYYRDEFYDEMMQGPYYDDIIPSPYEDDFAGFTDIDDEFADVGEYQRAENGLLVSMMNREEWAPHTKTFKYVFDYGEEGLYFLIYQVCPANDDRINYLQSTFELDFHFRNYDLLGHVSYLTAGELHLPLMYLFFTISYGVCTILWIYNIYLIQYCKHPGIFEKEDQETTTPTTPGSTNHLPLVYPIHKLMGLLLLIRTMATLLECIRYHYIKITGHADVWSVVYYLVAFIKGTFLFTIILLIGSGWSNMKPFLNEKERNIIFVVLFFQVINQMILAVLSQEVEGERRFDKFTALFHIIDIICCCAVLLPIVWQVDALEKSVQYTDNENNANDKDDEEGNMEEHTEEFINQGNKKSSSNGASSSNGTNYNQVNENDDDEEEGDDKIADKTKIIERLKLFRSFYLLVVAYIYSTRILVYLFMTMLDYQHLWLKDFITETLTLAFYVVTGLQFKPQKMEIQAKQPAAALAASIDDETITESELEMMVKPEPKNKPKPKPKSSKEQD